MCGIYGQFNFQDRSPVVPEEIRRGARTLAHRGPDDDGLFVSGPVGLGFRRLSIIDLEGGHQPMSDIARSVWVVFNGEIYNFPELRKELSARGHLFRTRCDTEVIVHGYREWGEQVFARLNGMFGLALWDARAHKLILARDAMGIKPVYYRLADGALFFGSEIRSLLPSMAGSVEVDPVSLNLFLRYRYTPSPLTLFKGVRKLAPGTMLTVTPEAGAKVTRWYRFKPIPFAPRKTLREAKQELTRLYTTALERHLISDVPVGLLLSGGIDSALLLALMNRVGAAWSTYSVGYGKDFHDDELEAAARTAALFNSRHVSVELTQQSFEAALPKVVSMLEEPVATSSVVPMYLVCQRARQDVKVALIGQGPDELFGGYTRHLGVHYGRFWRRVPGPVRRVVGRAASRLPRSAAIRRGLHALDIDDDMRRFQQVFSVLPGSTINGLFHDGMLEPDAGDRILECWSDLRPQLADCDELGAFQVLEVRSSLPDELLIYADKLSMAHGLEVRVPYLDREVVEFAQRLDASLKVRRGSRKVLHRAVCADFLPPEIIRRKKRGFACNVVDKWFRQAVPSSMVSMACDPTSLLYQFLRPAAVRALVDEHEQGSRDHHKILFSLIVFEEWLRAGIDQDAAAA